MTRRVSDIAFTAAVKAQQERRGSRAAIDRMERTRGWRDRVTPDLTAFLAQRDSAYLATSKAAGQPYVQHRGGPPGFLKPLDEQRIGFADFAGNRQYITLGNLTDNPQAFLFVMDYASRQRIKIWGRATVVENDEVLLRQLADPAYPGRVERAILFTVTAWDINCPQHIQRRYTEDDVAPLLDRLQRRIDALEAEVARLRAGAG